MFVYNLNLATCVLQIDKVETGIAWDLLDPFCQGSIAAKQTTKLPSGQKNAKMKSIITLEKRQCSFTCS